MATGQNGERPGLYAEITRWHVAPDPLPELDDNIHVWAVNLNAAGFDIGVWRKRLSPHEQERADRFKFSHDRRRYIVAHVALRAILGAYLKVSGDNLQFSEGENGKPRLTRVANAGSVEFNLSHSHEKALIAVAHVRVVGVDIEFVKNDFAFRDVANHFFTDREIRALTALPPIVQRRSFYKCWTSKEALLKAKGVGLSGALDEVEISCDTGNRVEIHAAVPGWWLTEIDPCDGYEGALVVEGGTAPIFGYQWMETP
jgi:4'-phosphopantetheinyl transferase